jgi:hypothetical protein
MTMMNAYDYYSKIVRAPGAPRRPMRDPRTARLAKGRPATVSYRYTPVPPEDHYERATARRYRRIIAARIARAAGWVERPPAQVTREGIAQDFALAQRQHLERRARNVGRRIGLTDGRVQPANNGFGSR